MGSKRGIYNEVFSESSRLRKHKNGALPTGETLCLVFSSRRIIERMNESERERERERGRGTLKKEGMALELS